jgi:hypothetical protein
MSTFYKRSNNESTIELFDKRLIYESDMVSVEYTNLINFLFAEKYLYGRVSRNYTPIEINLNATSLKNLAVTNKADANGFQAMDFVADAFNDLNAQFRNKVMSGQISANDQYLTTLEANKAYESPRKQYSDYFRSIKNFIIDIFTDRELNFKNFQEFITHFEAILEDVMNIGPISYPAFIKSRRCTMEATGLVINIASLDYSNDEQKIEKFKNSPNWEFYLNACRSYGFSVDANNPWRLVADLGSPEMIQYARRYGRLSTDVVLAFNYMPAHITFYENFANLFLAMYNEIKNEYVEKEYCQNGNVISRIVTPVNYTMETLMETFSKADFLKLYMKIRLMEEKEVNLNEMQKENLQRDCSQMFNNAPESKVIAVFEKLIAETYNNSGSLTDLIYRVKVSEQERVNVLSNT